MGQIRTRLTGKSRSRSANRRAWGYKPPRPRPLPHAPFPPPYHPPLPGASCPTPSSRENWTAASRCTLDGKVLTPAPQSSTPSSSTPPSPPWLLVASISHPRRTALGNTHRRSRRAFIPVIGLLRHRTIPRRHNRIPLRPQRHHCHSTANVAQRHPTPTDSATDSRRSRRERGALLSLTVLRHIRVVARYECCRATLKGTLVRMRLS